MNVRSVAVAVPMREQLSHREVSVTGRIREVGFSGRWGGALRSSGALERTRPGGTCAQRTGPPCSHGVGSRNLYSELRLLLLPGIGLALSKEQFALFHSGRIPLARSSFKSPVKHGKNFVQV